MKRTRWLALCLAVGCANPKEEWTIAIGPAPGTNLASITVGDTLYMQPIETDRGVNGESSVITASEAKASSAERNRCTGT